MNWLSGFFGWLFSYKDNSKLVAQVQAATVKACGFLPYAEVVGKLLAANPAVTAATMVATQICKAVSAPKAVGLMSNAPMIGDVVIEGEYINPKE